MISIDFEALENKGLYKLLIGSVVPRPIAFVTSVSHAGVLNGAPFSYFSVVSSEPPLLSISIRKEGNEPKDTLRNILQKNEFVIHIVSKNYLEAVNQSSFQYPQSVSEIEVTGLTTIKSHRIDVMGVKEAKIRFECVLEQVVDLPGSVLVIGRVVYAHFDESVYHQGKILIDKLEPISRLAGSSYAMIGDIIELKKPTE